MTRTVTANFDRDPADPIAVVAMTGRFTGAPDTESPWRLPTSGAAAIDPWYCRVVREPVPLRVSGPPYLGVDSFGRCAGSRGCAPRLSACDRGAAEAAGVSAVGVVPLVSVVCGGNRKGFA